MQEVEISDFIGLTPLMHSIEFPDLLKKFSVNLNRSTFPEPLC